MTTALFGPITTAGHTPARAHPADLLDQLSRREREVLTLMADGRSNRAIGEELGVGLKTVETHVCRVFTKLGLSEDRGGNRRVLAVLAFLGRARSGTADGRGLPPTGPSPAVVRRQWAMSTKRE